jgi:hypothetical protein
MLIDVVFPLVVAVVSPIITAWLTARILGLKKRRDQPNRLAERLDILSSTVQISIDETKKVNDAITTLFRIEDNLLESMIKQNGGIRELSKSVCNGNKEEALRMCDEADELCEQGRKTQKEYLLKR